MVTLRPASLRDADFLFALRTDPVTAESSFHAPPTPEEHRAWLIATLAHPDVLLFIAEADGVPIGMGRLDWHELGDEVSLAVAPQYRGGGFAAEIISALTAAARGRVTAHVKGDNVASLRAFLRAGWRAAGVVALVKI